MTRGLLVALAAVFLLLAPNAGHCLVPVAATTFPVYLIAQNVAKGGGVELTLLVSPELGCPHDYQLTPGEMRKLSSAKVVIKNGLGLEEYLDRALGRAGGGQRVIDASEGIGELLSEAEEGRSRANPHLFASPRLCGYMAVNIARGLALADPPNAALYEANGRAYKERCDETAEKFVSLGKRLAKRAILAQHAVFDYLARDMGLNIVAVLEEHAGREPGAAQMRLVLAEARKSGAAAVFTEPQYPRKLGETFARELSIPVAELDPVASGPENAPLDYYFRVMEKNLAVLEKILGVR